ncbi:MAG: hypothetical protein N2645_04805 [Clostridia bacterium]|nr:hypothetical protein [Clostridia bacterium]
MAQFCTCGSLVINDQCTNKNCSLRTATKTTTKSQSASKQPKKEPKTTKTRRASKVVTYNLYDVEKKEENVE